MISTRIRSAKGRYGATRIVVADRSMIGFWKKIENGGYGGFSMVIFKMRNL